MNQEYNDWVILKHELIQKSTKPPKFNEGDIWWCSVGINVGYEVNGKNNLAERCVLVLRKYNNKMFFGLPLTTKLKGYDSRIQTKVVHKDAEIILDQGKSFSANRLNRRCKVMNRREFNFVRQRYKEYLVP